MLGKGVRNQQPNGPQGAPHYEFLIPFPSTSNFALCNLFKFKCVDILLSQVIAMNTTNRTFIFVAAAAFALPHMTLL